MKRIGILVLTAAITSLAGISAAEIGGFDIREGAAVCFTKELAGQCGVAATGDTIICLDGSAGPAFERIAEMIYRCVECTQGQSGLKKCTNTGDTKAKEITKRYGCPRGTYGKVSEEIHQECDNAQLDGDNCKG